LLLVACGFWVEQNKLVSQDLLSDPSRIADVDASSTQPLVVHLLPQAWLRPFSSLNPGIAGLILLLSPFWPGWRMQVFLIPAAVLVFLGETLGMPGMTLPLVGALPPHRVSLVAGGVLLMLGWVFDRLGAPYYEDRTDF
jgi:hypothetical protein